MHSIKHLNEGKDSQLCADWREGIPQCNGVWKEWKHEHLCEQQASEVQEYWSLRLWGMFHLPVRRVWKMKWLDDDNRDTASSNYSFCWSE